MRLLSAGTAAVILALLAAGCADPSRPPKAAVMSVATSTSSGSWQRQPDASDALWWYWLDHYEVDHTAWGSYTVYVYYGEARDGSGRTRVVRTLIPL